MDVIARSKFIRRAPRKARLVADSVRGMRVEEALTNLQFAPQHAATDVAKTIRSAAANAEHNFELDRDELWLKTIMVDEGPTMKRIRPVSRGMAHQYFHRTCHITVVVEDRPDESRRRRRPVQRRQQEAPEASIDEAALAEEAPDEVEEPTTAAATATAEPDAEPIEDQAPSEVEDTEEGSATAGAGVEDAEGESATADAEVEDSAAKPSSSVPDEQDTEGDK